MNSFYTTYLRPSFRANKGLREVVLFVAVSIFYKFSRYIAIGDADTAFRNANAVVELERSLHIFYEISVQQFFLTKLNFIKFCNQFYTAVHVPSIIAFFMWLYHKQRAHYFYIRNCFLIANFFTLFIFIGFPCAPPRMLNDIGFVDTLLEVSKVNLYNGALSHFFNQYAAMPSMHFGTSLLIGVAVSLFVKSFAARILLLFYPIFVLVVIVATGNHFFLDALVGGVITALPFVVTLKRRYPYSLRNNAGTFKPSVAAVK